MPTRTRLYDVRTSDFGWSALGICPTDIASVAALVNKCQRRLVFAREAGETGWYGSWAEMSFTVDPLTGYLTTPRDVARLINLSICRNNFNIQNEFYEYMDFGIGPQPGTCPTNGNLLQAYSRNNVPTFVDLVPPNKKVRVRMTDAADQNKRVFVGGLDNNSNVIYTLDNGVRCRGTFIVLAPIFADSAMEISRIDGIQKDITYGPVHFYEVDMTTGDEVLLLTMEPGEKVASYRRYFIQGLPNAVAPATTVTVTAMAKLELIDVVVDTDYLLLQGQGALEALAEEAQGVRLSQMDNMDAKKMAQEKHVQAIRMLQGQLVHQYGKNRPAIGFMLAEKRSLQRAGVGMI